MTVHVLFKMKVIADVQPLLKVKETTNIWIFLANNNGEFQQFTTLILRKEYNLCRQSEYF